MGDNSPPSGSGGADVLPRGYLQVRDLQIRTSRLRRQTELPTASVHYAICSSRDASWSDCPRPPRILQYSQAVLGTDPGGSSPASDDNGYWGNSYWGQSP